MKECCSHQHTDDHSKKPEHTHPHNKEKSKAARSLKTAFLLNLFFALIELIGGIYTNSLAIISDAFHDFGDALSLGLAWGFEKKSLQEKDHRYTYGYRRFSLLSALITSSILLFGSLWISVESIQALASPREVNPLGMIGLSLLGIVVNFIAYKKLHHGHSHNEKSASLHLLEDVLGWIIVLFGSIAIYVWEVHWLDPVLSLSLAIFILYRSAFRVKEVLQIFLQKVPHEIDFEKLKIELHQINGVQQVVDLHLWSMDGEDLICTISVVLKNSHLQLGHEVRNELITILKEKKCTHITVETLGPSDIIAAC